MQLSTRKNVEKRANKSEREQKTVNLCALPIRCMRFFSSMNREKKETIYRAWAYVFRMVFERNIFFLVSICTYSPTPTQSHAVLFLFHLYCLRFFRLFFLFFYEMLCVALWLSFRSHVHVIQSLRLLSLSHLQACMHIETYHTIRDMPIHLQQLAKKINTQKKYIYRKVRMSDGLQT